MVGNTFSCEFTGKTEIKESTYEELKEKKAAGVIRLN